MHKKGHKKYAGIKGKVGMVSGKGTGGGKRGKYSMGGGGGGGSRSGDKVITNHDYKNSGY